MFRIKLLSATGGDSEWLLDTVTNEHNHPMFPDAAKYSRSALKPTPDELKVMKDFAEAGISMPDTRKMLQSKNPGKFYHAKTITNNMAKFKRSPDPQSNQAMDLLMQLAELKRDHGWYYSADIDQDTGELNRVFWMDPEQMALYRRYHDVIVNDSTAQTNTFGMPLNVTVVIDNSGASRIVALALIRWEAGQDSTRFVNCIWHINQNFKKFVSSHIHDPARAEDIRRRFKLARDALTAHEFEDEWSKLEDKYGSKKQNGINKRSENQKEPSQNGSCDKSESLVGKHLQRLYNRRFRWALPWTGTCFTAGVRSFASARNQGIFGELQRSSQVLCLRCHRFG